jgi:hypothetical protein
MNTNQPENFKGLSAGEVRARLKLYGANEIVQKKGPAPFLFCSTNSRTRCLFCSRH